MPTSLERDYDELVRTGELLTAVVIAAMDFGGHVSEPTLGHPACEICQRIKANFSAKLALASDSAKAALGEET